MRFPTEAAGTRFSLCIQGKVSRGRTSLLGKFFFTAILFAGGMTACGKPMDRNSMGDIQIAYILLSRDIRSNARDAQILVDQEGLVHAFWVEDPGEGSLRSLYYQRRLSDGTWEDPEVVDDHESGFYRPYFLWGHSEEPCYTYYDSWTTPILKLKCRTAEGWMETSAKGYLPQSVYRSSVFLDGDRLQTAYEFWDASLKKLRLYFGETALTESEELMYGRSSDLIRDASGTYHLAYIEHRISDGAYLLLERTSSDQGRSWSVPIELSGKDVQPPKYFLGKDGTLFLAWGGSGFITLASNSNGAEWRKQEIPLGEMPYIFISDLYLGQDREGILHIIAREYYHVYAIKGISGYDFSAPELIWDMEGSEYRLQDLSFAVGGNGGLYFSWTGYPSGNPIPNSVYFGWLP